MWHRNVFGLKSSRGAARFGGGACRARRSGPKRLRIESLEPRALLSANITRLDLPLTSSHVATAGPAAHAAAGTGDGASAFVMGVAWGGAGQVEMNYSSSYTDDGTGKGDGPTPTGKDKWAWVPGLLQAPEAWLAGSTPTLYATMSLSTHPAPKNVHVKAIGDGFDFEGSAKVPASAKGSMIVELSGGNGVGDKISDRQVGLAWYVSVDGGPMITYGDSINELFVTYSHPVNPKGDPTTVARMRYACDWANGVVASNTTDVADAIDLDAMSHYDNRQTGDVWTGKAAWEALYTPGVCADCSWLMDDALGMLGIGSDVYYIYPQAETAYSQTTGQVTHGWAGLRGTQYGWDEYRTHDFKTLKQAATDYLGYLGANGEWENYEACCYVYRGGGYYLGGIPGMSTEQAYSVWNDVTKGGTLQRWYDQWAANPATAQPVDPPKVAPPTY